MIYEFTKKYLQFYFIGKKDKIVGDSLNEINVISESSKIEVWNRVPIYRYELTEGNLRLKEF
jgi:hypothetical protein